MKEQVKLMPLWIGFALAIAVYGGIVYLDSRGIIPIVQKPYAIQGKNVDMYFNIFLALSFSLLMAIFAILPRITKQATENAETLYLLLAMTFSESVAILGLIYFFLSGDPFRFSIFAGASFLALCYFFPGSSRKFLEIENPEVRHITPAPRQVLPAEKSLPYAPWLWKIAKMLLWSFDGSFRFSRSFDETFLLTREDIEREKANKMPDDFKKWLFLTYARLGIECGLRKKTGDEIPPNWVAALDTLKEKMEEEKRTLI